MDEQLLFEQNPNPMLVYDRDTLQIMKGNEEFFRIYKYSPAAIAREKVTLEDLHIAEEIPAAREHYKNEISNGSTASRIWRHQSKEGSVCHVRVNAQEFAYKNNASSLLCITDVTPEVKKANKFRKAFEELNYHLQNTSLALVQWDREFRISKWSERAAEISGYPKEEVLGKKPMDFNFWSDEEGQKVRESMELLISGEKMRDNLEVKMKNKSGELLPIKIHSSVLKDADGALISVITFIEDFTSEKKAREKLRRSEKLFKKLFTNAPQAMVMVDDQNNVQRVNNSFENLFGYNASELRGRNLNEVIRGEDQAQTVADNKLERGQIYTELKRYSKEGNELHVVVGGIPVYLDGTLIAGFGIYIDITAQKEIQRKLEESLSEKQVLLEEVHHRVKNNLAIVSGLLQMQTMHVDDERLSRYIQNSQLRIRSMAIVHEMLYESQTLTALDMKNYVQQLVDVISGTISPDDKAIETKVESDDIELNINQAIPCALAISELITNAYEYAFEGRPGGCIEVRLAGKGEQVAVQVRDDGIGLPDNFDEMRQKSLGLSLIENLCIQLETEIKIDSGGWGTRFAFTFQKKDTRGSSSTHRM